MGSGPNDPMWKNMWYVNPDYKATTNGKWNILHRSTQKADIGPGLIRHMNVTGAWAQGYTGRGIVVTILDDGVEKDHPDLKHNFAEYASYDRNDKDFDPTPRYNPSNENRYFLRKRPWD